MNKKQTGILGVVLALIVLASVSFLAKDSIWSNTDSDTSYIAVQNDETNSIVAPKQSVETQIETETETEQNTTVSQEQFAETQIETATEQKDTVSQEQPAETQQEPEAIPTETAVQATAPAELKYKFKKSEYLTEHFQKHGAEFPYATEDEYLAGANHVIENPNALHKLEAEDGDDVYYVESTNEFVIVSTDGYIRTYFRPDSGIDYFDRQ